MKTLLLLLVLAVSGCSWLRPAPDAFDHPDMVCWPATDKPLLFCTPVKGWTDKGK